jgi:hypothetical protein
MFTAAAAEQNAYAEFLSCHWMRLPRITSLYQYEVRAGVFTFTGWEEPRQEKVGGESVADPTQAQLKGLNGPPGRLSTRAFLQNLLAEGGAG